MALQLSRPNPYLCIAHPLYRQVVWQNQHPFSAKFWLVERANTSQVAAILQGPDGRGGRVKVLVPGTQVGTATMPSRMKSQATRFMLQNAKCGRVY